MTEQGNICKAIIGLKKLEQVSVVAEKTAVWNKEQYLGLFMFAGVNVDV